MAEKQITEGKAPEAEAPGKGHGACCHAREGELGENAPGGEARGKGHGECRYTVDVGALDWDAWLAQKALQRAAWRARGG